VTVRVQGKDGQHTIDAQTEADYARTFGGFGADTDIIVASAKAYLSALNKLVVATQIHTQDAELKIPTPKSKIPT
jgi:2-isopropylmalate synthase